MSAAGGIRFSLKYFPKVKLFTNCLPNLHFRVAHFWISPQFQM
jgi:hypothetical protein